MNRLIKSLFTLFPLLGMVSCSSNSGSPIFFSVDERPSNIIINPGDPNPPGPTDPPVPDGSTHFIDAVEMDIGDTGIDDYQYYGDVDYYGFSAEHTNYIYFNVEYGVGDIDWYYSTIEFYHEINDVPVFVSSYSNEDSIDGTDLSSLPTLYVECGEYYYFRVYQDTYLVSDPDGSMSMLRCDNPDVIRPRYYATVSYANGTDKTWDEYPTSGYLWGLDMYYLEDDIINIYFDETCFWYQNTAQTLTYYTFFVEAMSIWNGVGEIQFVSVTNLSQAEVICTVTNIPDTDHPTALGITSPHTYSDMCIYCDVRLMNCFLFDSYYPYCLDVAIHELGHCLNILHINDSTSNVMHQYAHNYSQLGRGDIDVYRYLYGD